MILIADSGSTTTDWRLIDNDKVKQYKTKGINPYHDSIEDIITVLSNELPKLETQEVYFYGAGCSSDDSKGTVANAIDKVFKPKSIEVQSDILASARALCMNETGIVGIIGTGSSSCFYDGEQVHTNIPSLGYILGDEGSGSWIGKRLVSDYFGKSMDSESRNVFQEFMGDSLESVLDKVYVQKKPAAFLASFSNLVSVNINKPYFYRLVHEGFNLFVNKVLKGYDNSEIMPIHFSGSVAFIYGNILRKVVAESGMIMGNIVQSPIAGLTLYHQMSKS